MAKPSQKQRSYYDWDEIEKYIKDELKINIRDYAAHKNGIVNRYEFNRQHRRSWQERHYPDKAFTDIAEQYHYASAPDGSCLELPFWDFWDFLCDTFEMHNGEIFDIHWQELKEHANCKDWQKEIVDILIREFGDEMTIQFSW